MVTCADVSSYPSLKTQTSGEPADWAISYHPIRAKPGRPN